MTNRVVTSDILSMFRHCHSILWPCDEKTTMNVGGKGEHSLQKQIIDIFFTTHEHNTSLYTPRQQSFQHQNNTLPLQIGRSPVYNNYLCLKSLFKLFDLSSHRSDIELEKLDAQRSCEDKTSTKKSYT